MLVEGEEVAGLDVGDGAQREAEAGELCDDGDGGGGSVFGDGPGEREARGGRGAAAVALQGAEQALEGGLRQGQVGWG